MSSIPHFCWPTSQFEIFTNFWNLVLCPWPQSKQKLLHSVLAKTPGWAGVLKVGRSRGYNPVATSQLTRLKSGDIEWCGTGPPPCVHVCAYLAVHVHLCVCVHVNALCIHISAYRCCEWLACIYTQVSVCLCVHCVVATWGRGISREKSCQHGSAVFLCLTLPIMVLRERLQKSFSTGLDFNFHPNELREWHLLLCYFESLFYLLLLLYIHAWSPLPWTSLLHLLPFFWHQDPHLVALAHNAELGGSLLIIHLLSSSSACSILWGPNATRMLLAMSVKLLLVETSVKGGLYLSHGWILTGRIPTMWGHRGPFCLSPASLQLPQHPSRMPPGSCKGAPSLCLTPFEHSLPNSPVHTSVSEAPD